MQVQMEVRVDERLSKEQVFEVAKLTNKVFGKQVLGGKGKKVATIGQAAGKFCYTFSFDCDSQEENCDLLANELYTKLSFDFELEIDCEVHEEYLVPCDLDDDSDEGQILIEDEPSVKHAKWMSRQVDDGWRFGMEYDEKSKTSPYLRPYHTLSVRQREELSEEYGE